MSGAWRTDNFRAGNVPHRRQRTKGSHPPEAPTRMPAIGDDSCARWSSCVSEKVRDGKPEGVREGGCPVESAGWLPVPQAFSTGRFLSRLCEEITCLISTCSGSSAVKDDPMVRAKYRQRRERNLTRCGAESRTLGESVPEEGTLPCHPPRTLAGNGPTPIYGARSQIPRDLVA